jgi:hypothetical protein
MKESSMQSRIAQILKPEMPYILFGFCIVMGAYFVEFELAEVLSYGLTMTQTAPVILGIFLWFFSGFGILLHDTIYSGKAQK